MLDPRGDYKLVLDNELLLQANNGDNENDDAGRDGPAESDPLLINALCPPGSMPCFLPFRRLKYSPSIFFALRSLLLLSFALLIILFIFYYLLNNEIWSDFAISNPTTKMAAADQRQQIIGKSKFFKKQIVHLDLKGAAPRPEYLLELLPLFKTLGFNGILMEYEDMFPYHSGLSMLSRKTAYNDTTIIQFNKATTELGLEYIPLIQTFGHLEFALKHPTFSSLREDHDWMDTICPSNDRSIWLIREMLAQIRNLHPTEKSIHIGCDEAWHVGLDRACRERLNSTLAGSISRLKLEHISRIARMAKDEYGFEQVYAWNDMFDKISVPLLSEYKLGSLLIPVIWGYNRDVTRPGYFPEGLFERYSHIFDEVYFAGAFKGADGVTQQFVNLERYQQNLLSYRRLYYQNEKYLKNRLFGMVLTGWQRFSHTKPLCELLPVGIPSLVREAIFLSKWEDQTRTKEQIDQQLRIFLNCPQNPSISASDLVHDGANFPFLLELQLGECTFPGVELYREIQKLNVLRWKQNMEKNNSKIEEGDKKPVGNKSQMETMEFKEIMAKMGPMLGKIYYEDTVREWLSQHTKLSDFKDDDPMVPRFDPL